MELFVVVVIASKYFSNVKRITSIDRQIFDRDSRSTFSKVSIVTHVSYDHSKTHVKIY